MSAGLAKIQRRLRTGARNGGIDSTSPDSLRLVLRELLFDGEEIPGWRRAAACRDVDPEIFYPPPGRPGSIVTSEAVQICAGCPVRPACLADVMSWERPNERHGVIGGLTPTERVELASHVVHGQIGPAGGVSA